VGQRGFTAEGVGEPFENVCGVERLVRPSKGIKPLGQTDSMWRRIRESMWRWGGGAIAAWSGALKMAATPVQAGPVRWLPWVRAPCVAGM